MRAECVKAVEKAIGRKLNADEADAIEARIVSAVRRLARAEPERVRRMPQWQRLSEAATLAAKEIVEEGQLEQRRVARQIMHAGVVQDYVARQAEHGIDRVDAMGRLLAPRLDGRDNVQSVETRARAIQREAYAQLSAEIEALGPRFLGLVENEDGARALLRELKGEASGVTEAGTFAAKWKAITEGMRERFNAAGGKIRYLEDWGFPQHHSQALIGEAGISRWVQTVYPLLDRSRYFDQNGRPMGEDQFRAFLETTWRTLATGGLLDVKPGKVASMVANRHAAARQLHFKSAEAYIKYHGTFGEKSLMATLLDHVDGLSRDLALVEILGPNPEHQFAVALKKAMDAEATADPKRTGAILKEAEIAERLYAEVSGSHPQIGSVRLARSFDTLRNWLVSTRLGSALITSFSDEATMQVSAHVLNLPAFKLVRNEIALLNPANDADRRILRRAGLGLETVLGSVNRAGQEHLFSGLSARVATFAMRSSGLNFVTDARRQAFGATMMDAIGSLTRDVTRLADLDPGDHRMLLAKGITEADWQVWRRADLEEWGAGNGLLTPEAIQRIPDAKLAGLGDPATVKREAALRLLGAVTEEVDVAVIQPGARERVLMHSHLQRGTWKGELVRSFFLFKSFPISMIHRHWTRAMEMPEAGQAYYLAALVAGTTLLGALSLEVNDVLSGRDPRNLNPFEKGGAKAWFAAMLKGGSLGLYGDFLYSESTQGERGAIASALGPVVGLAEELVGLTQGNLIQLAQGKDPHAGAELVRFGRGLTPGANHWYAKAALDRLVFHNLQEMASPGYLRKMRARAQREFGAEFYWQPGEAFPSRAPAVEAVAGQ